MAKAAKLVKPAKAAPAAEGKKKFEPNKDILSFNEYKVLQTSNLQELVAKRQEAKDFIKTVEETIKKLDDKIMPLLIRAGVDSVRVWNGVLAIRTGTTPRKVSVPLLVEEGVDPDVIERCVVGGKPTSPYIQFKGDKEEED